MKLRKALENISPYIPGKLKEGAIKLASNENPLGTSPRAAERLKKLAENVSLYPDGGCVRLKELLAKKYGLKSGNFIVGNGSDEVLLLIAGAYIEAGSSSVVSESTFSEYTFATMLFGGEVRKAPLKDGRYDLKALAGQIDKNTKLLFLCNPNNPTGTYFTGSELVDFMAKVPATVLVVLDEAYFEYVEAPDYPDSLALLNKYKNMIILRTFSKIYGLAGLRVGYGISTAEIIDDLNKAREPFNVNSMAQEAALGALEDDDFVKLSRETNKVGKAYLVQEFKRLGLTQFDTQANFIFVRVNKDCLQVFQELMDLGVTIRPMKSFGYQDAIRVTIGTMDQNRFFIQCLEKVL